MRRRKWYVFLLLACTLIILTRGRINYTAPTFSLWDLHDYREIAAVSPHIATDASPPFAYRLLGPYLVGLLPLRDPTSFSVAAATACVALAVLFYRLLLLLGLREANAFVTTLLFTFNRYFFGFFVWDPFQIDDVLAMICIVLSFTFMMKRRWVYLAICLALGALTREAVMVMIPVILVYLWEAAVPRVEYRKAALAVLPALAVFFAVRLLVPGDESTMSFAGVFSYYWMKLGESIGNAITPVAWFRRLCWSFLPLTFIPIVFWKRSIRLLATRKYIGVYFVLIVITNLWGIDPNGGDVERQMAPSFLAFYWLIGQLIEREFVAAPWAIFTLLCSAFLATFHHMQGIYPLPSKRMTLILTLIATIMATCAGLAVVLRNDRRRYLPGDNPAH